MSIAQDSVESTPIVGARGGTCSACGAPVDEGDRFCNACGSAQEAPPPQEAGDSQALPRVFHCQSCGADVQVDPNQRSYVCPFCESTYVMELPAGANRQRPEFVIGFAVTPEQAAAKYNEWIRSNGWFRPGDLPTARIEERLRGVYVPFWSFSTLARSRWSASIGEYWYRTETYTTIENGKTVTRTRRVQETEWWPLSGRHHRYYSGYLVSGSKGLPQGAAEGVKPFQLAALKRYEPYFLAGWLAEEYSIEREQAERICRQEFERWATNHVGAFLPGDTHRNLAVETEFSETNSDLILLPVYLLTYRYQQRLYRFLINGQTGKVSGEKPLSWKRISGAIAGVVLAVLLAWLLYWWLSGGR